MMSPEPHPSRGTITCGFERDNYVTSEIQQSDWTLPNCSPNTKQLDKSIRPLRQWAKKRNYQLHQGILEWCGNNWNVQTSAKPLVQCTLKLMRMKRLWKTTVVLNNDAERVGVAEFKNRLKVVVSPGQPADPSTTYGCCYIANVREGTSSSSVATGVDV